MTDLTALTDRAELPLLIAFVDLTGFARQAAQVADDELALRVDGYYELIDARVDGAGGLVVKYIGDGALIVFTADQADVAVDALLALADDVDGYFAARGWPCRLLVRAHAGTAIAGPYGGVGRKRLDVIGNAVNAAAMLPSTGVALSADAWAALSPALQARFVARTAAVTYARPSDPVPFRRT